jgi:bacillithiol biosynthesis cysteine-adding enzyme BshC
MEPACIRYTDLPGVSRLFADFCYQFPQVSRFYRHDPHSIDSFAAAARELSYPEDRRAAMARALAAQNGQTDLLRRFREPGTAVVVTGQQVGLFSGPAYTIYKALTAARLATDLTARGVPAVPVFWLATEDHDFEEVASTWVFDAALNPRALTVPAAADRNGRPRPVGTIAVAAPPLSELRAALAGFPYGEEVTEFVAEAYAPGATLGSGFRALLKKLLGRVGMLVLDPLDPAVREIGAPFMAQALREAPALKSELLARNAALAQSGYHAQVHLEETTSLFFLLENGERTTLRRKDTELATLQDRAADVSPNAILRPVWQDFLLPTVAYLGGPAELAYLGQAQVVYERLLGRMPVVLSRSSFTLLDARASKLADRYRLSFPELLVPEEALRARIARALVPESVARACDEVSRDFAGRLDQFQGELERFDPTLAAALQKSRSKILHQVGKIRRKTELETLRRDTRAGADARHLSNLVYPHASLQERVYSILPFLARHGTGLVDQLYDSVRVECAGHRILVV